MKTATVIGGTSAIIVLVLLALAAHRKSKLPTTDHDQLQNDLKKMQHSFTGWLKQLNVEKDSLLKG